jgi:hypothetical protein
MGGWVIVMMMRLISRRTRGPQAQQRMQLGYVSTTQHRTGCISRDEQLSLSKGSNAISPATSFDPTVARAVLDLASVLRPQTSTNLKPAVIMSRGPLSAADGPLVWVSELERAVKITA